jgi:hypothetical protein
MNYSELLVYQSLEGRIGRNVLLEDETAWLAQTIMVELFRIKRQNITIQLKKICTRSSWSKWQFVRILYTFKASAYGKSSDLRNSTDSP